MTFSIIARCPRTHAFGIAAATGMPGVGKLLTHARARVGAVATQGLLNPYLGLDGLDALVRTALYPTPIDSVLNTLMHHDADRETRQVAMIDAKGETAVWTGSQCLDWAGSRRGAGYSIQGNLLSGPEVVDACEHHFMAAPDDSLDCRLMRALEAGEAAGGDRRGTQSATIYIVEAEDYPLWDIRVDHHERPLAELRRIHARFSADLIPHIRRMATRDSRRPTPSGRPDSPC